VKYRAAAALSIDVGENRTRKPEHQSKSEEHVKGGFHDCCLVKHSYPVPYTLNVGNCTIRASSHKGFRMATQRNRDEGNRDRRVHPAGSYDLEFFSRALSSFPKSRSSLRTAFRGSLRELPQTFDVRILGSQVH
jgi:hypothetical protein